MFKHTRANIWIALFINWMIFAPSQVSLAEDGSLSQMKPSAQAQPVSGWPLEIEFIATGGYRVDDLDWNIAGDISGNNPNVLSELTWDDLEIYQLKFQGRFVWPNLIALRGELAYGWIFDGTNQDSDYLGNNRSFEFSRSNNSTEDDNVWDGSLAAGYPARFGRTVTRTVTPLAGYSRHEQRLKITDGYQSIPAKGPFPGLDSSYDTKWRGPWVGIHFHFKAVEIESFADRFETYFTYEYHWADFDARGDWNLRDDLAHPKSFKQNTDGNGFVIRTGFNFTLNQHWALNFNYDYQDWSMDDGTSKIFFADGTTAKTRLNEVNWTSHAVMMGLSLRF